MDTGMHWIKDTLDAAYLAGFKASSETNNYDNYKYGDGPPIEEDQDWLSNRDRALLSVDLTVDGADISQWLKENRTLDPLEADLVESIVGDYLFDLTNRSNVVERAAKALARRYVTQEAHQQHKEEEVSKWARDNWIDFVGDAKAVLRALAVRP